VNKKHSRRKIAKNVLLDVILIKVNKNLIDMIKPTITNNNNISIKKLGLIDSSVNLLTLSA
jgi:hypothetical protein